MSDYTVIIEVLLQQPPNINEITRPKAFFQFKIGDEVLGKLIFELASDVVPRTVENFMRILNKETAIKRGYKGTKIHYIQSGHAMMGGDIEKNDGSFSHSSFAKRYFEDENFIIPHSGRGLLRYWTYFTILLSKSVVLQAYKTK